MIKISHIYAWLLRLNIERVSLLSTYRFAICPIGRAWFVNAIDALSDYLIGIPDARDCIQISVFLRRIIIRARLPPSRSPPPRPCRHVTRSAHAHTKTAAAARRLRPAVSNRTVTRAELARNSVFIASISCAAHPAPSTTIGRASRRRAHPPLVRPLCPLSDPLPTPSAR